MSEENKPEENLVPVEPAEAVPPPSVEDVQIEDLKAQLAEARDTAARHWDQLLRLQAEMENARRRAERDVENAHKFALERFAQELLPVRDSLELGLTAAEGTDNLAKLREGTELTLRMLTAAMEKYGVKLVDPVDQPFNPTLHQAVSMQDSDKAPNTVIAVMQKGYTLNDRLIRPAMVMVSRGAPGEKPKN